jgi:hypothetical protein
MDCRHRRSKKCHQIASQLKACSSEQPRSTYCKKEKEPPCKKRPFEVVDGDGFRGCVNTDAFNESVHISTDMDCGTTISVRPRSQMRGGEATSCSELGELKHPNMFNIGNIAKEGARPMEQPPRCLSKGG